VLRHFYTLRGAPFRLISLIYWPLLDTIVWGYMNRFMVARTGMALVSPGVLIAAVLLWEVMLRVQMGALFALLEEFWSRNLGQLFVSPLRSGEFLVSIMLNGLMRMVIGVTPAVIGAMICFDYSIFSLGPPLLLFVINLVLTGWWIGLLIVAMLLRFGQAAEELGWTAVFGIVPLACVYYPVAILPLWLQHVAWALPPVYVFESLRALMAGGALRLDLLAEGFLLNLAYFIFAAALFFSAIRAARREGRLLHLGEF